MHTCIMARLESLQIACPRFRKFTTSYVGNVKIARPRSRLQDTNFPDWYNGKQTKQKDLKYRPNYTASK